MYPVGHKTMKGKKGSRASLTKSPIGVILISESFYVKQVFQKAGSSIATDGKGGATVPWHYFDAGTAAACLASIVLGDCMRCVWLCYICAIISCRLVN